MSFVACNPVPNYSTKYSGDFSYSETIQFSPSKQYAIFVMKYEPDWDFYLVTVDILNRSVKRRLRIPDWESYGYVYWLSNNIISVFTQSEETSGYHHFVYRCYFECADSELELIQKTHIPFQSERYRILPHADPCRLRLQGHDFLFVRSYAFLLAPFNPTQGPALPVLNFDMADFGHTMRRDLGFGVEMYMMFASHNNSIYFYLVKNNEFCFDHLLKVQFNDLDLVSRTIIPENLDLDNPNFIQPEQLTAGTYKMKSIPMVWHSGNIAIMYESNYIATPTAWKKRKAIILNMENETIMEKKIKNEFTHLTLYKGYLLLWKTSELKKEEISFKFQFLNDHVPKLSDICTVKLLGQPKKNEQFVEMYKNLMSR